jgi:hypothetical protein
MGTHGVVVDHPTLGFFPNMQRICEHPNVEHLVSISVTEKFERLS